MSPKRREAGPSVLQGAGNVLFLNLGSDYAMLC